MGTAHFRSPTHGIVPLICTHAQLAPPLAWRSQEQHRAVIVRAVRNGTMADNFWWADDNSIRRGRTADMVQMLDDIAAVYEA